MPLKWQKQYECLQILMIYWYRENINTEAILQGCITEKLQHSQDRTLNCELWSALQKPSANI